MQNKKKNTYKNENLNFHNSMYTTYNVNDANVLNNNTVNNIYSNVNIKKKKKNNNDSAHNFIANSASKMNAVV